MALYSEIKRADGQTDASLLCFRLTQIQRHERKVKRREATHVRIKATLKRVTIVTVQKQYLLCTLSVCLWPQLSSMHSACAVLYCQMWPARLYCILLHYPTNSTIWGRGEILNIKSVFWYSEQVFCQIF
jgi:hypothetical protein